MRTTTADQQQEKHKKKKKLNEQKEKKKSTKNRKTNARKSSQRKLNVSHQCDQKLKHNGLVSSIFNNYLFVFVVLLVDASSEAARRRHQSWFILRLFFFFFFFFREIASCFPKRSVCATFEGNSLNSYSIGFATIDYMLSGCSVHIHVVGGINFEIQRNTHRTVDEEDDQ